MNKEDNDYSYPISITFSIPENSIEVIIRNIRLDDIGKLEKYQENWILTKIIGVSVLKHFFGYQKCDVVCRIDLIECSMFN